MTGTIYWCNVLILVEAEQSEEQLYQEISKVVLTSLLILALIWYLMSVHLKLILLFVFAGKCYLHSLLGQQQEVNWKGEHAFSLCSAQFIRYTTAVCLEFEIGFCIRFIFIIIILIWKLNYWLSWMSGQLQCLLLCCISLGNQPLDPPHKRQDGQGQQVCWCNFNRCVCICVWRAERGFDM